MKDYISKHPYRSQLIGSLVCAFPLALTYGRYLLCIPIIGISAVIFAAAFVTYPIMITIYEIRELCTLKKQKSYKPSRLYDLCVILLAILYDLLYLSLVDNVHFQSDWDVVLVNAAVHTPVFTGSAASVWAVVLLALAGFSILATFPVRKLPPLVPVLSLSAMYLGILLSLVWTVQIFQYDNLPWDLLLLLLPVNCIAIFARVVLEKIAEYEPDPSRSSRIDRVPLLGWCNRVLQDARLWPMAAFLLMWPLLGILVVLLILFGQAPDSLIKAWTETSQFTLSQKVSPQNIYVDEHYLCTVAAGGHRRIVRPQRRGIRHGHEVTVNRQLCVANAFEQILEERTPRFHRAVRHFYDTYGFPVAQMIRSRYTADLVYFLMKPLEWLFVIVLYLTDWHPEDRIALQYTGKSLKDFE